MTVHGAQSIPVDEQSGQAEVAAPPAVAVVPTISVIPAPEDLIFFADVGSLTDGVSSHDEDDSVLLVEKVDCGLDDDDDNDAPVGGSSGSQKKWKSPLRKGPGRSLFGKKVSSLMARGITQRHTRVGGKFADRVGVKNLDSFELRDETCSGRTEGSREGGQEKGSRRRGSLSLTKPRVVIENLDTTSKAPERSASLPLLNTSLADASRLGCATSGSRTHCSCTITTVGLTAVESEETADGGVGNRRGRQEAPVPVRGDVAVNSDPTDGADRSPPNAALTTCAEETSSSSLSSRSTQLRGSTRVVAAVAQSDAADEMSTADEPTRVQQCTSPISQGDDSYLRPPQPSQPSHDETLFDQENRHKGIFTPMARAQTKRLSNKKSAHTDDREEEPQSGDDGDQSLQQQRTTKSIRLRIIDKTPSLVSSGTASTYEKKNNGKDVSWILKDIASIKAEKSSLLQPTLAAEDGKKNAPKSPQCDDTLLPAANPVKAARKANESIHRQAVMEWILQEITSASFAVSDQNSQPSTESTKESSHAKQKKNVFSYADDATLGTYSSSMAKELKQKLQDSASSMWAESTRHGSSSASLADESARAVIGNDSQQPVAQIQSPAYQPTGKRSQSQAKAAKSKKKQVSFSKTSDIRYYNQQEGEVLAMSIEDEDYGSFGSMEDDGSQDMSSGYDDFEDSDSVFSADYSAHSMCVCDKDSEEISRAVKDVFLDWGELIGHEAMVATAKHMSGKQMRFLQGFQKKFQPDVERDHANQ